MTDEQLHRTPAEAARGVLVPMPDFEDLIGDLGQPERGALTRTVTYRRRPIWVLVGEHIFYILWLTWILRSDPGRQNGHPADGVPVVAVRLFRCPQCG